jgi:hypothetical protein
MRLLARDSNLHGIIVSWLIFSSGEQIVLTDSNMPKPPHNLQDPTATSYIILGPGERERQQFCWCTVLPEPASRRWQKLRPREFHHRRLDQGFDGVNATAPEQAITIGLSLPVALEVSVIMYHCSWLQPVVIGGLSTVGSWP